MKKVVQGILVIVIGVVLSACSPKVGSPEWCAAMKKKPSGDWTANETGDFATHCLFK